MNLPWNNWSKLWSGISFFKYDFFPREIVTNWRFDLLFFILFSAPWPSILKNKPNASRKEMMKIMTRYSLHLFYFDLFFSWNCNNQLTKLFVYILRALKNNLRKRTRKMSIHYPNWVTWSMLCFPRIKRPFCLFSTK